MGQNGMEVLIVVVLVLVHVLRRYLISFYFSGLLVDILFVT